MSDTHTLYERVCIFIFTSIHNMRCSYGWKMQKMICTHRFRCINTDKARYLIYEQRLTSLFRLFNFWIVYCHFCRLRIWNIEKLFTLLWCLGWKKSAHTQTPTKIWVKKRNYFFHLTPWKTSRQSFLPPPIWNSSFIHFSAFCFNTVKFET